MILLTVEEDPAVIQHTLDILRKVGGSHEVHTASNLSVAENSARELDHLDVLISPVIASSGENFFGLRNSLRARFPKLHVLFLNDYDIGGYRDQLGDDTVLPRRPDEAALAGWARSIGFATLPKSPATQQPAHDTEPLLEGSPAPPSRANEIPVPVAATDGDVGSDDDEELPVAGLVVPPAENLGDYKLVRIIASHAETETHEAVQLSIGRTVALVLLKPEFGKDTLALREFRGAVRAKAAVTHPYITPVYEAHEEDGAIFYTRELVDGLNLPQLAGTGKKINQRTLIQIVRVTAECFKFMRDNDIRHIDLEPRHIYLGRDAQVRLTNIAALSPKNLTTPAEEIAKVAAAIRLLVSDKPAENHLILPLLAEMESQYYQSWESLLTKAQEHENKIEEAQTYSVSGGKPFGVPASSRKTIAMIAAAAIAIAAVVALFVIPIFDKPKPIATEEMPRIPAGDFIFQEGRKRSILESFWIDKYEVTIAQYAEFLAALQAAPTKRYDHPGQAEKAPEKTDHTPLDWDVYYPAAKLGRTYDGSPIDVNCPVILVDWWDAYAYAKWKGHRLPTEEEWSKAARGTGGNLYPWGNDLEPERFNSSDPDTDRFSKWAPVDAMPGDVSPFGVIGTAGNVSEWTASEETHPEFIDRRVPIIRGGNFRSPKDLYRLTYRRISDSASDRSIYTGFRTVTNTDPKNSAE